MSNPAETYENYMVPAFFAPWASHLIESASPQPGERVLDVACGTAIIARRVAPLVGSTGKVTALDLNPHMLTVARAAAEREGLAIEWHEGRSEGLPFSDASFELALCQAGLMFFADRDAALAEMHRVLTNSGRVVLSVLQGIDRHPFYKTLDSAIQQRLGMSSLQDIFDLGDAEALRALLTRAGFRNVEIDPVSVTARFPQPDMFLAGEIDVDTAAIPSMQHLDSQARLAITSAISEDMKGPMSEVTEGDHVVMPFHTFIARAIHG